MSLLFLEGSQQRVRVPRDAAIDDLAEWSVLLDLYPTTITLNRRCDIWKKSHAKRIGTGEDDDGTVLLVKQNYNAGGLIQYRGTFFDAANTWYCACVAVNSSRAFIYKGKFSDALAEISYSETIATPGGAGVETDVTDPTYGHPGDVIFGNEGGRFNFQRGYPGRIGRIRWWSAALTLNEFRLEYHAPQPVRWANLEGDYHLGWDGLDRVIDRSGNGRHGSVLGGA